MVSGTVNTVSDHILLQLTEHVSVLLLLPHTLLAPGDGEGAGQGLALVLHADQVVDHLLTLRHRVVRERLLLEQSYQRAGHWHVEDGGGVDGDGEHPGIVTSIRYCNI